MLPDSDKVIVINVKGFQREQRLKFSYTFLWQTVQGHKCNIWSLCPFRFCFSKSKTREKTTSLSQSQDTG